MLQLIWQKTTNKKNGRKPLVFWEELTKD